MIWGLPRFPVEGVCPFPPTRTSKFLSAPCRCLPFGPIRFLARDLPSSKVVGGNTSKQGLFPCGASSKPGSTIFYLKRGFIRMIPTKSNG
ncbi:hypothetical protein [African swine fever virus]|uniref:Uncharacterized protein n=1 Tax=African swine fever virus TaxID=10497 RepID=A0A3G1EV31_ASF|nr:hypothetical protein F8221_gp129 [African swine fever virus]AOO54434.1 hypothetical protein AFSV47Ss_0129 [African swine fever virus]QIM06770.1 hypothetical protein [African swine fever virus]QIM07005.1 hypothetical protein [African swine fever virus]QIM07240.1 hypothetical protein [African swine fever virus]QIM07475.1 hypothetical protein [African swine fever virus]